MLRQSAHCLLPGIAIALSLSAGFHGADGSVGRRSAIQVVCGVPGDRAEERTGSVIAPSLIHLHVEQRKGTGPLFWGEGVAAQVLETM